MASLVHEYSRRIWVKLGRPISAGTSSAVLLVAFHPPLRQGPEVAACCGHACTALALSVLNRFSLCNSDVYSANLEMTDTANVGKDSSLSLAILEATRFTT